MTDSPTPLAGNAGSRYSGSTGTSTSWADRIDRWMPLLLLLVFMLVRIPFRSDFLVNWDSVNFALGVESFDLSHHQPHAPGYIGYVALGRFLAALVGDANGALTMLSAIAGGVLPATSYLLARRFLDRRWALVTAVLIGTSPIVWYYSSVALTYIVSAALTVPFVWAAVTARADRSRPHLLLAAGLLASVGAIRQTDLVLLLPLFLYAAWAHVPRDRWRAMGLLGLVSALWLVPLLLLAGGVTEYLRASAELAELAGGRTWALGANPLGWAQNVGLVALGIVLGLNIGLVAIPLALRSKISGLEPFGDDGRRMLLLWAVPATLTYLLIHTGQIGYVLLVLPALALWVGGVAQTRSDETAPTMQQGYVGAGTSRLFPRAGTTVAVVNTAVFLLFPPAASGVLSIDGGDAVGVAMADVVDDGGVVERTRQYDLNRNDRYWKHATKFVETFDPDETALLTVPNSGGSFRHFGYYLEDYRVYGIGFDRSGRFGHLFTAFQGETDYAISGFRRAEDVLELPREVRWVLVADRGIQNRLLGDPAMRLDVHAAPDVLAYRVDPGSVIVFFEPEVEMTRMGFTSSSTEPGARPPRFQHEAGHDLESIG